MADRTPTTAELLDAMAQRFARAGIASARGDARWLVRHALGWSAAQLTLATSRPLTGAQVAAIQALADRRAAREPLQLVLGGTDFRGHPLTLRPGVFVPRPETELLVDLALDGLPRGAIVVEPCTGSGAVACAIAVERPDVTVLATDLDDLAVEVAGTNAAALGAQVDVRAGWLLDPVPQTLRGRVAVLVANPPYLAEDELDGLEPEVRDWDPPAALVAGPTGHEVSDLLFGAATSWLSAGGRILLELDERRVAQAARHAERCGLVAVGTHRDLTGRLRFVSARR